MKRKIVCMSDGKPVRPDECDSSAEPDGTEPCNEQQCTENQGNVIGDK